MIKGKKSGCRRSLAASTPQSRDWVRRRSNNPGRALGRQARKFLNHTSHSPHRRRSRAHRPDPAGNCRLGSGTHELCWTCAYLFPKTDATAPVLCAAMRSRRIEEVPADGGVQHRHR